MDILVSPIGLSMLVLVIPDLEGVGRAIIVFNGPAHRCVRFWCVGRSMNRIRPPPRPP